VEYGALTTAIMKRGGEGGGEVGKGLLDFPLVVKGAVAGPDGAGVESLRQWRL